MNNIGNPKKTPLYNSHLNRNAKLVDFSGWLLPVQFSGILKEHNHTRQSNSIFDICHMGELLIEGAKAESDLSSILAAKVKTMSNGCCRYGFLLNDKGTFIDDLILYKYSETKYMIVVNAGRTGVDYTWIRDHLSSDTSITDISEATAKIDLQGPLSIQSASLLFGSFDFSSLSKFRFSSFVHNDYTVIVSATGYTGETGFEFFIPEKHAEEFWNLLLNVETIKPAGLGARDSLRLEKGFSLYGHDINENINPFEAGLDRFLSSELNYIGADALKAVSSQSVNRKLVPFICEGRRTARDGFEIFSDDKKIGFVTSGAFSPSLKRGIGLCIVDSVCSKKGTHIICKSEDIEINAVITELPFVKSK